MALKLVNYLVLSTNSLEVLHEDLTGEHGDTGRGPSNSVLTFDLLVFRGFTVLLTAESPLMF